MPSIAYVASGRVAGSFLFGVLAGPRSFDKLQIALSIAGLLIGITIAYRVFRLWQEVHEEDDPASNEELLAEFAEAYHSGELDEAEYRRVTQLLMQPQAARRRVDTRLSDPPDKSVAPPAEEPGTGPPSSSHPQGPSPDGETA